MRKKFFAVYALVGALVASPVFTSCIDDTESASVTAVRNAKAAQIKATADYEKQMNELELALKQLEVESKQMSLEEQKINYEKVKVQAESAIAQAKYQTANYTQLMYQAQDGILTELATNYTSALENIVTTKESIISKNADVVALENGIVSIQEYVAEETESLNENIAAAEAKIELWKDAEGGVNKEEINAEIAALNAENQKLRAEKTALQVEYGNLSYGNHHYEELTYDDNGTDRNDWFITSFDEVTEKSNLATINAARKLMKLSFTTADDNIITEKFEVEEEDPITGNIITTTQTRNRRVYDIVYNFVNYNYDTKELYLNQEAVVSYKQNAYGTAADELKSAKENLAKAEAVLGTEADKVDTKYQSDDTHLSLTKYAELAAAKAALEAAEKVYAPLKEAKDKALAAKNEKETALNEAKDAQTAYTGTDAAKIQALADAKDAAQTAYDAAQTAYDAANTALTTPIIDAYDDAVEDVEEAELAIAQAIDNIKSWSNYVADKEEAAAIEAEFDSYIAAFEGEDYAAYEAAISALAAKDKEIKDNDTEKYALNELLSCTDVEALIADEIENIEAWKEELAELEEVADTWVDNYGFVTEAEIEILIGFVKERIANLEIKLALYEKQAEQAKAALDAYLGTEEGGEAEA